MSSSVSATPEARCRCCGHPLHHTFVDLGKSPLCESYLRRDQLNRMEPFYPLHVWVCERCLLVQLEEYVGSDAIFRDYAYFSSFSESWLAHAEAYVELAVERFALDSDSYVMEIASNDGYLLKNFVERGIPCLGVDPARNVAAVAQEKGVPTLAEFFGKELAQRLAGDGPRPDLVIGNNVLAQVPDLNDFVAGVALLLAPDGMATFEFPHLVRLVEQTQFDTIYHEHFSYFSLLSARTVFSRHGLVIFDVEEIPTHGGSLRVYVRHQGDALKPVEGRVEELAAREKAEGLGGMEYYAGFSSKVEAVKRRLLRFLLDAREAGKSVVGYGAPGKGNTLLNYCGIRTDLLAYTVDRNPRKQGMFMPGTHIPIFHPDHVRETRPDYLLILPWNLKEEIMEQMAHVRTWGGLFVVPIPEIRVME